MDRWIGRGIREDFVGPFFLFSFFGGGQRSGSGGEERRNTVGRRVASKERKKGAMTHYVPNIYCPLSVQMRNIRHQSPGKTAVRRD